MSILAQVDFGSSLEEFGQTLARVLPQIVLFLLILIVGYFVAKAVGGVVDKLLERFGFNRAVERGGVGRALESTKYHPSDILGKIVFYALMLFVLQLAFGVFGPNPISDLIQGVIAYLPNLFVAIVIIVIAAAIAAAVRDIVAASLGGLPYGRVLSYAASGAILVIGGFAALDQLQIAPTIVNALFIALLAIVAGTTIVAVGGGGVIPMRRYWERMLDRVEQEAPRVREQAQGATQRIEQRVEQRRDELSPADRGDVVDEINRPEAGPAPFSQDATERIPTPEPSSRPRPHGGATAADGTQDADLTQPLRSDDVPPRDPRS